MSVWCVEGGGWCTYLVQSLKPRQVDAQAVGTDCVKQTYMRWVTDRINCQPPQLWPRGVRTCDYTSISILFLLSNHIFSLSLSLSLLSLPFLRMNIERHSSQNSTSYCSPFPVASSSDHWLVTDWWVMMVSFCTVKKLFLKNIVVITPGNLHFCSDGYGSRPISHNLIGKKEQINAKAVPFHFLTLMVVSTVLSPYIVATKCMHTTKWALPCVCVHLKELLRSLPPLLYIDFKFRSIFNGLNSQLLQSFHSSSRKYITRLGIFLCDNSSHKNKEMVVNNKL